LDQAIPRGLATAFAFVAVIALAPPGSRAQDQRLIAHEWGTFTSIAGKDGSAADWLPLSGPNDLPCFVNRFDNNASLKAGLVGTVRMETPVLYFYTPHELTITAEARFPQGVITEWYPYAEGRWECGRSP
jgi:hypothetical protein